MAKVFIEESTLTNIGNSIRNKTGKTDLIDPALMSMEIDNITSGGGDLPEEALIISGTCDYKFSSNSWNWYIDIYGDRITTQNITSTSRMFFYTDALTEIPFQINLTDCTSLAHIFSSAKKLTVAPKVRGTIKWSSNPDLSNVFSSCERLRNADGTFTTETLEGISINKITSAYSCPKWGSLFSYCYSLRKVPDWFYSLRINEESTAYPSPSYLGYYYAFSSCHVLDEVINMPVYRCAGAQTTDMFSYTFNNCNRLANFTFETQADGTPYEVKWKSQTIDLSQSLGYAASDSNVINYNSGITRDSEVWDDETYQARKNDPDWYGRSVEYSRYNHDSAVNTINSLPDTSTYLATAGGTNTIKFKGASGSSTDGGAINTLTEEEIAVATAKGWTVTLV